MTLFTIHCTTCRARLRVKDAVAIGQILDCPKCGSLVQVTPPAGWQPTAAAVAVQSTSNEPAAAVAAAISGSLSDATGAGVDSSVPAGASETTTALAGATEAEMPNQPPPLPARSARSLRRSIPQLSEASAESAPPPAPSALWSWPVLAVGAAAGVVASVGLWIWLASGGSVQTADSATTDAQTSAAAADAAMDTVEPNKVQESAESTDDENWAADEMPDGPSASTDADPSELSTPADPDAAPAPGAALPDKAQTDEAGSPIAAGDESTDDEPAESDSDATAMADDAEAASAPPLDVTDSDERMRIEARLADKLPKLEFNNVPLADFLQFLADFSTLPIELDEPAIRAAGKTAAVRVKLRMADTTVEAALAAALAPHGLVHEVRAGGLLVKAK